MKNKFSPLRRAKAVYYFEHRNGVLESKPKSATHTQKFSGVLVALFIFGGTGVAAKQLLDYRQERMSPSASLQRQSTPVDTSQKASEEDKLKDANKKAREDEQLAKNVKSKLKNVPGAQKWSVYIRDVKSDRMASINADNTFEATNLSNLFMTIPLEAKLDSASWNYRAGKSTVAKCVQLMISSSDATCSQSVSQYADLKNSEGVLNGASFKKTTLKDKQQTTARETGELLYRLQSSQLLSDKARRIVFDGLYGQKMREGIPAGCDQKCLIANIAGESKTVRHDAAIVTTGDSQYVVVIMTNGGSWSQIADVASFVHQELKP